MDPAYPRRTGNDPATGLACHDCWHGRAQGPGPGSRVDNPQDVEVTDDLPMSLTAFVGRERELDELRSLFREGKRLVTLVGIGGIGKTRLALELGFSASDLGWAKVYFVELASLTNPGLVDGAVLESVGGGSSRSPLQAAAEHLREANALLVLDCCEHVLNAARRAAEVLLRRCPSVVILATSRSPLDIAGELVWPVPPLSMQKRSDAGEAGASDAARLFADRASYVQPRFELSEDAAGAVEIIVRRVDGIPLAIELAAARVRVLSAEEIACGLDDHLRLLRGGHQSDPRHQAIRASLDWSHELLTDRERQLFARLSVFSGGFDLEAATAVCAGGAIVPDQILDEIQGLVDKSLLTVERRAGATRFRMLDFVRQYASERLAAAGEGVPLAERHRAYFGELAQRADRELWALVPAGRARLDDESPNLRAAIDDGCARAPDDALAMAGALGLYWRVRGRLAEGVTATEQSLRAALPDPSPRRALALAKLSLLSFWLGDFARTQSSAASALEMGAAIGDIRSQALALGQLGALVILGDPGTGDPMLVRAAELARTAGDDVALCDALTPLAISYFFQDDPGAMRSPHDALKVLIDNGWRPGIIDALDVVAEVALFTGQYERAVRLIAAGQKERTTLGLVAFPLPRERTERNLASAGAALGDESLQRALQDGARLSLQEAVAYAQRGRGEHADATHGWASLSPVERQVVELASQGLSNPDIARELFISRNTVKVYLSHAYAKLGVANRTELARLATRHSQARQPR